MKNILILRLYIPVSCYALILNGFTNKTSYYPGDTVRFFSACWRSAKNHEEMLVSDFFVLFTRGKLVSVPRQRAERRPGDL